MLLLLALLLTATVFFLRVAVAEPCMLRTADYTVTVPRLPAEHDGLLIALAADLHYRPGKGYGVLSGIGNIFRERKPDLVLLGGDFVDRHIIESRKHAANLAQFVTDWHGRYGTFAVSGNHDMRHGMTAWKKIAAVLQKAGVTILDNRGIIIPVRGKNFQLFGVCDGTDAWFHMGCLPPEFDRSLPVYGLLHNPEYLYSIRNPFDMVFSAHTHHGQIRFPVFGAEAVRPLLRTGWFGYGLRTHLGCTQIITSGIGMSKYPIRWHDLPEVSFITLKRATP